MEEKKINIIVTDDHNLFRKGIVALISEFEFVDKISEAENGIELLKLLASSKPLPDVILLDLNMPGMDGIEANKKVKKIYPGIKIIVLTMEDDEQLILHLIEQGIDGYLLKNADQDEMELALKKVIERGLYFSTDITDLVIRGVSQKNISGNIQSFSEKEKMILDLICKEKTTSEIADNLNLSVRTIEGYREKLMKKSGAKNLAGIVVFAIKNNLVSI